MCEEPRPFISILLLQTSNAFIYRGRGPCFSARTKEILVLIGSSLLIMWSRLSVLVIVAEWMMLLRTWVCIQSIINKALVYLLLCETSDAYIEDEGSRAGETYQTSCHFAI